LDAGIDRDVAPSADQRCEHWLTPGRINSRQNGTLWTARLKRRFFCLTSRAVVVHAVSGEKEFDLEQPRLLLIDDEPALADFLANAARECGFEPVVTSNDNEFRETFQSQPPDVVAL